MPDVSTICLLSLLCVLTLNTVLYQGFLALPSVYDVYPYSHKDKGKIIDLQKKLHYN